MHPPPSEQHAAPISATQGDHSAAAGDSSADVVADESTSFSLFGMLARWNKEGEDAMRVLEFQEQVSSSFLLAAANRFAFGFCVERVLHYTTSGNCDGIAGRADAGDCHGPQHK